MRNKVFILICLILAVFSLNIFAEADNEERPFSETSSPDETWQRSIEELRGNLGLLLGENQELRQKAQILNSRIIEVENLLKKSEAEKDQLSSQALKAKEDLERGEQELRSLKKPAEAGSNKLRGQLNNKISELENSQNELEKLKKEKIVLEKELLAAGKSKPGEVKQLQQDIQGFKNELVQKNAQINKLESRIRDNQAQLEAKKGAVLKITKEKERLDEYSKELSNEVARLSQNPPEAEGRISSLQNQLRSIVKEKETLENEINSLKNDLGAKSRIIFDLNKDQEVLSREKAILESLLTLRPSVMAATVSSSAVPSAPLPIERPKPPVNHEVLGYNLAREGRLNEAIEEYKKAVSLEPNKKDLYFNLAYLYFRIDDFNKAIENYKKVLKINPKDREVFYNLSKIYELLHDEGESRRYYEAYLKLETK